MLCSNECCPLENNHIPAALSAVNTGDALKLSMVFSGENTSCDLPHLTLHTSLDVQWERVVHRSRFASPTSCDICGFLVSISGAFRMVSPISSPSPGEGTFKPGAVPPCSSPHYCPSSHSLSLAFSWHQRPILPCFLGTSTNKTYIWASSL